MRDCTQPKLQEYPSWAFSHRTGVKGLYENWKLPEGYTAEDLALLCQYYIHGWTAALAHALIGITGQIRTLNPSLPIPDTTDIMVDLIMGVVSKFNLPDIKHFMSFQSFEIVAYNKANKKRMQDIEIALGCSIHWVASPYTFSLLESYINLRNECGI